MVTPAPPRRISVLSENRSMAGIAWIQRGGDFLPVRLVCSVAWGEVAAPLSRIQVFCERTVGEYTYLNGNHIHFNRFMNGRSLMRIAAFGLCAVCSSGWAEQYAEGSKDVVRSKIEPPTDVSMVNAPYRDKNQPLEQRVEDLFKRLTDEEKASLLHGCSGYEYGDVPRIGLTKFIMSDAQLGVRLGGDNRSTYFPCGTAMASTWNQDLIKKVGEVIASECKATNSRIILGPAVNLMRTPLGGRSFEYFGEDPFLAGKIAASFINAVQANGVSTSLKHWLFNDQEWSRTVIDVDAPERALREIYAKPFEIAVREANPWTIMCSYNKVRGKWASHQRDRLNNILYDDWKWDGTMVSDWGAWHGDADAVNGGCYLEMPSGKNADKDKNIVKLVNEGKIDRKFFEDAVKRNIRFAMRVGAFTEPLEGRLNAPEHQEVARQVAREAVVLLKNDKQFLPLDPQKIGKIAVIGPNADQYQTMVDGFGVHQRGGAAAGRPPYEKTPLAGIVELFGKDRVLFAPGFRFEDPKKKSFPDMKEWDPVEAAKEADVVIFVGGTDHTYDRECAGWGVLEGGDKPDLNLKGDQVALLDRVLDVNPKTVVALVNGAPVQVEEWIDRVPSLLELWYGGMDAGTALAEVVTGKVNPSGKLPCTFGKRLNDWKSHSEGFLSYPGDIRWSKDNPVQFYSDDIWVGYRHFDKAGIEPRFPFGYGLSYTTFSMDPAGTNPGAGEFSVKLTNTGDREGAETVQCYITKPESKEVPMPVRELAGFKKVNLKPGQSEVVTFKLTDEEKKYWSEAKKSWDVMPGEYKVSIGNSSRNLPVQYSWK